MSATHSNVPAVELRNVAKVFGRFAALRELSATFAHGRLCAIFGENGAGKSTLLRLIAGLARPTRGRIEVFGEADVRAVIARLGYMAHASMLYDELSARENLRYFGRLYGVSPLRCDECLLAVGLDPALDRPIGDYSQGMRQRAALARAMVHDPDLLLLDEPFSNVDAASAQLITDLLGRMRAAGKTILVVTHQAAHLAEIADESLRLSAGCVTARAPGIAAAEDLATRQRPPVPAPEAHA
ncbi:MAG: heme ABC exporter ATP-binding protein CcmA [Acidobacteria bacterium]|nr:heme ABC exporter ATP-binding protein CcmA [Acidobacteriota bacterium]